MCRMILSEDLSRARATRLCAGAVLADPQGKTSFKGLHPGPASLIVEHKSCRCLCSARPGPAVAVSTRAEASACLMRSMRAPCLLQCVAAQRPCLQSALWTCVAPPRFCTGPRHLRIPRRRRTSDLYVCASNSERDSVDVSTSRAKAETADEALSAFLRVAELFCIAAAGGLQVHCCGLPEPTCVKMKCLISVKATCHQALVSKQSSLLHGKLQACRPARPPMAGALLQVAVLLLQQQQAAQQQAPSAADSRKAARAVVRPPATTAVPEASALQALQTDTA